jgi:hypothetical protein
MPGPYRSILNPYRAEIADLRKTLPPTPYSRIAEILKEKYNVVIRASSIWSFVKARSIQGERKLKYVMAESPPAQSQLSQAAPTASEIHNAKKLEPSPEIEADPEGAKPFKVNKP